MSHDPKSHFGRSKCHQIRPNSSGAQTLGGEAEVEKPEICQSTKQMSFPYANRCALRRLADCGLRTPTSSENQVAGRSKLYQNPTKFHREQTLWGESEVEKPAISRSTKKCGKVARPSSLQLNVFMKMSRCGALRRRVRSKARF